jgi:hypothetical protein
MISAAAVATDLAMQRTQLKLHRPSVDLGSSVRWLINGFPATLLTWTAEEWDLLTDQPNDAQECPNGVWCALRME